MTKFERRFFKSLHTYKEAAVQDREAFEAELDDDTRRVNRLTTSQAVLSYYGEPIVI